MESLTMTDSCTRKSEKFNDPTKGFTQAELEKKYGTVAANDENYMKGIRRGLDRDHSYSGGFWWPKE